MLIIEWLQKGLQKVSQAKLLLQAGLDLELYKVTKSLVQLNSVNA